jgi:hypothetical protein
VSRSPLLWALLALASVACGQKGAPLAPIVFVPRAVTDLAVKRIEEEIVIQFKVPEVNTDGSGPADLERVDVYAHTGPLPTTDDFLKYGTLVGSIDVKEPPPPPPPGEDEQARADREEREKRWVEQQKPGSLAQGAVALVSEAVTPKHLEPGPVPPPRAAQIAGATVVEALETDGTVNFALPPERYYTVVGVSRSRSRRGPYAGPIRVPLVVPPAGPPQLDATYTADAITLSWPVAPEDRVTSVPAAPVAGPAMGVPSTGAKSVETRGTRDLYGDLETPQTVEPPMVGKPAPAGKPPPPPAPRFGYNVYEVAPRSLPPDAGAAAPRQPSAPLNASLLTRPTFSDSRVEFGIERCYVVRRVEMASAIALESPASPVTCVTMLDTFAPAAPKTLQSVASGDAVNLIWEANGEADLAGYEVLRGEAPGDKLAPLTKGVIAEPSYVDGSARRGRTYMYEVIAVDKAGNRSAPSNRVEDTVR